MKREFRYITKLCQELTDKELELCSALFSQNYGKYNGNKSSKS